MLRQIVIVGGGGFGREVHDVIDAINAVAPTWEVLGYADDNPSADNERLIAARHSRILGGLSDITVRPPVDYVIGIGNCSVRARIDSVLSSHGWTAATLVHPRATLGFDVQLSDGVVICSGARITTNISMGRHVHIDQNATVGHDVKLADYCRLNPQACISGSVTIAESTTIGANATVLQNLTIGAGSIVGAGSVVTRSVPDATIVKGAPAR